MEQQHGGGASNSSHDDEGIIKDNNNNNCRKRVIESSSPSPSTSYNHETHKNDGGEDNEKDDIKEDENLTPSTAEDVNKQGKELESTKAEIGEVMQENQRLKQYLNQIMSDYQMLQSKFVEISQQDSKQKVNQTVATPSPPRATCDGHDDEGEDQELVSLSLGRSPSLDSKKGCTNKLRSPTKLATNHNNDVDMEANKRSLDLGLDCKFKASSTSDHPQTLINLNETKDNEALKNNKDITGGNSNGDDELTHQPPMKKARVSVRVRCDTPTMNDGCQWRKYGQKIAKGNPCPRGYYRCTVAPSCPVRKQVQRCAEDKSILITTYEGAHNHPLPISATAMASTTSAAAYMLMSKSSTSSNPGSNPSTTTTTTPIGEQLHGGLKFNVLNNFEQNPFFPPNSSTFSPTPIHPTVTLDLTSTPLSSTNNQFNKVAPNLGSRFSSTNLTFNFSENSNNSLYSWPNNNPLHLGSSNNTYNNFQRNLLKKSIYLQNNSLNHDSLPESLAQAAKVLTSDPSFQSILTATLSSFINGNNGNANSKLGGKNHQGEGNANNSSFVDINKWDSLHTSSANSSQFQSTSKDTNGCISSLSNKAPIASNSEVDRSYNFLTPSLPFTSTKSTSSSPDNINHTN